VEITKEQFAEWTQQWETKAVFGEIEDRLAEYEEFLTGGGTLTDYCEKDTAHLLGRIAALREILDISYEDSEDDETSRMENTH